MRPLQTSLCLMTHGEVWRRRHPCTSGLVGRRAASAKIRRIQGGFWHAAHVIQELWRRGFRWVVLILTLGTAVLGGCLVRLAYEGNTFWLGPRDKATVVVAVLTFDALVLTLVAVGLALMAYWVASGAPNLKLDATFPALTRPKTKLPAFTRSGSAITDGAVQIEIENLSAYMARNPSVEVAVTGAVFNESASDWQFIDRSELGVSKVWWDGGSDRSIHGRSKRPLPVLLLKERDPDSPLNLISITVWADGIRPEEKSIRFEVINKP